MIRIKGMPIGEGIPKICIPLTAETPDSLSAEARSASLLPCDLVEWRADFYQDYSPESLSEGISRIRRVMPDKPILFTLRSKKEGGRFSPETASYLQINRSAIAAGADLIDCELSSGEDTVLLLRDEAHQAGRYLIGSFHDFSRTPGETEMEKKLNAAAGLGCDIAKIAVFPSSPDDVLKLLSVSLRMSRILPCPVIAISMGPLGAVSRAAAELFGSSITFGSGFSSSAPGQISASKLHEILLSLHC